MKTLLTDKIVKTVFALIVSCTIAAIYILPISSFRNHTQEHIPISLVISFATVATSGIPMIFDLILDFVNPDSDVIYFKKDNVNLRLQIILPLIFSLIAIALPSPDWFPYVVKCFVSQRILGIGVLIYQSVELQSFAWSVSHALILLLFTCAALIFFIVWIITNSNTLWFCQLFCSIIAYIFATILCVLTIRHYLKYKHSDSSVGVFLVYLTGAVLNGIIISVLRASLHRELNLDTSCAVMVAGNYLLLAFNVVPTILPGRIAQDKALGERRTNEARQSFVRYISHEIRTPLNVSSIGVALLEDAMRGSGNISPDTSLVIDQTKRALSLATETLNDLLVYEKLSSNLMTLERTLESPIEFINKTVDLFEFQAAEKKVALLLPSANSQDSKFKNGFVFIDTYKMSQVLRNLVSNALKFTPSGGSIIVSVDVVESPVDRMHHDSAMRVRDLVSSMSTQRVTSVTEWFQIDVKDSGVGLAPENVAKIFKEIIQFDANKLQQGNGSGLGLFISDGIMKLHDGIIRVKSDGIGKGCLFTIELPFIRIDLESMIDIDSLTTTTTTTMATPFIDNGQVAMHSIANPQPPSNIAAIQYLLNSSSDRCSTVTDYISYTTVTNRLDLNLQSPRLISYSSPRSRSYSGPKMFSRSKSNSHSGSSFPLPVSTTAADDEDGKISRQMSNILALAQIVNSKLSLVSTSEESFHQTQMSVVAALSKLAESKPTSSLQNDTSQFSTLDLRDKCILIADDSIVSLKMLKLMLKKFGAVCIEVLSGTAAFETVRNSISGSIPHIDIVIMDNNMDGMNGPESCLSMRNAGYLNPIFGLTGDVDPIKQQDFLDAGASYVFQKPLKINEFIEKMTFYSN